jgi:hypothetical protein
MILAITLAFTAFRLGLKLRRTRLRRAAASEADLSRGALRRRHLRRAKLAVVMLAIGAVGGPLALWLLLDRPPFRTVHALFGGLSLALFGATAFTGHRLEKGKSQEYDAHGAIALASILSAAATAIAGFVLLP